MRRIDRPNGGRAVAVASFTYKALDAEQKIVSGEVEAPDDVAAIRAIRGRGLRLFEIRPSKTDVWARIEKQIRVRQKIRFEDREEFTSSMTTLLEAGVPMLKALTILVDQAEKPAMQHVLDEIRASVQSGSSLSAALSRHPAVFDRLYIAMVKAGEIGGVLEVVMNRLAEFNAREAALRSRIKSAMTYPIVVLAVAAAVVGLMMTFVVPAFEEIFTSLGKDMPRPTALLIAVSKGLASHWWALLLSVAAAIHLCVAWLKTDGGTRAWARLSLRLPLIAGIRRREITSRFCRTLGTLLQSGIPILQALEICRETTGNVIVSEALADVRLLVSEGVPLGIAVRRIGVFPNMVTNMILVGEESGALEQVLEKIADKYDIEVEHSIAAALSALEPILIVFLGIFVAFVVVALFLPIIDPGGLIR